MAKRDRGRSSNTFGDLSNTPPLSDSPDLADTANAIFGTEQKMGGKYLKAAPTDIFNIFPDFTQPRRAIPFSVRGDWVLNPKELPQFLQSWVNDSGVDVDHYLKPANVQVDRVVYDDAERATLVDLLDLASSIKHNELLNPISVTREDGYFRIETGERRWLAYHILACFDDADRWGNIPARVVDSFNVWRQAAENGARDDLNAVGMARQLASLYMTIFGEERGLEFEPMDAFGHEREFYAQVADGEQYTLPRGYSERVLAVMGLKNPVQLRQYRAILRVSNAYWEEADDNNYPEGVIRKEVEPKGDSSAKPKKRRDAFGFKAFKKHTGNMESLLGRLQTKGKLSTSDEKRLRDSMDSIREWLDDTEQLINPE